MTSAKTSYRIPKIPVAVEINLGEGEIRWVEVFVAEHLDRSFRPQHVADLLASPQPFLPARQVGEERTALFHKDVAVWIRIATAAGALPVEESAGGLDELFEHKRAVTVELSTGESIAGDLLYSLPNDRARVIDYLNQESRFFRLFGAEYLYLVNKDRVVQVIETDGEKEAE